jgi:hypothetical protein
MLAAGIGSTCGLKSLYVDSQVNVRLTARILSLSQLEGDMSSLHSPRIFQTQQNDICKDNATVQWFSLVKYNLGALAVVHRV